MWGCLSVYHKLLVHETQNHVLSSSLLCSWYPPQFRRHGEIFVCCVLKWTYLFSGKDSMQPFQILLFFFVHIHNILEHLYRDLWANKKIMYSCYHNLKYFFPRSMLYDQLFWTKTDCILWRFNTMRNHTSAHLFWGFTFKTENLQTSSVSLFFKCHVSFFCLVRQIFFRRHWHYAKYLFLLQPMHLI